MPKVSPLFNDFSAGEFGGLLHGRVDLEEYRAGMSKCENAVGIPQGPWVRRPGTKFVAEVKTSSTPDMRLLPFRYSTTQAYIVELGNQYARFYMNHGQIQSGGSPYEIVTPFLGGYTSPGPPYVAGQLSTVRHTQSADVMYLTAAGKVPRKLTRTSHTSWTLTSISFNDGPYGVINATATTLTPSATTGTGITITASSVVGINNGLGFKTSDVGRLIRLKNGAPAQWGWAKIATWVSDVQVTADVISDFGAIAATTDWRMSMWWSDAGFSPQNVTFHEDRLTFCNSYPYVDRIDASRTGDYENFSPSDPDGTVAADHALSFTLNSREVNDLRWIASSDKGLLAGSLGAEWIIRPSSLQEAMSPTNVNAKPCTNYGSAIPAPVVVGDRVVFVQEGKRKVRSLHYVYEADGFRTANLTHLAPHVSLSGIKELAYQREPHSIIWAVRTDGTLVSLMFDPELGRMGWHRHELGGYSDSGQTQPPTVDAIAVIPTPDGSAEELWMIVKRYINGATKRYIEYMTPFREDGDSVEDSFFVDCGLTYDGAPTTTISGLSHLEGQTVTILADGATHPTRVVSGGQITLARSASKVHVGLGYVSTGKTLRPEVGAADGSAQGKTKRWNRVVFRLHDTLGLKVGPSEDNLTPIYFRTTSDALGSPPPLFSGDKEVTWEGDYDYDGYVCWQQDQPLPATVLAITGQVTTQDR